MVQEFKQHLEKILSLFDSLDLDDEYKRRLAVKPLYDYFQRVLLEVGDQLCGLHRNSLKSCHLKTRWVLVNGTLEMVEKNASRWDKLVITINNERMSCEHNDYYFPPKQALLETRKHATEFANWALESGKKYHEKSEGFTFTQEFAATSRWYIAQAERITSELGETSPFCVKEDYYLDGIENGYSKLKALSNALVPRSRGVRNVNELTREDLSNLTDLVRIVERVDARENIMVARSTCPKCGSQIVETEKYFGGSGEEEPHAVFYRVGCDQCNYVLDTETIDL